MSLDILCFLDTESNPTSQHYTKTNYIYKNSPMHSIFNKHVVSAYFGEEFKNSRQVRHGTSLCGNFPF